MPSTESVSHQDLILCACRDREYKTRDSIDAAFWRGDLDEAWNRFQLCLAAEKHADEHELEFEDDQIDSAAEAFRYERDLITAEETEQWLSARGLTLDDFGDYFTRSYWGTRLSEQVEVPENPYQSASDELRHLFAADVILSGEIDTLTTQLTWRLAAVQAEPEPKAEALAEAESAFFERQDIGPEQLPNWLASLGRDGTWFTELQTMEAAYEQVRASLLLPSAYKYELSTLRLPLTNFATEVIELESRDAAQEALFCIREDGMTMEEVAVEGRYPYRHIQFLLEDLPPDLQQIFTSVSAGELMNPMARGDGFELCRVISKTEPDPENPAVRERVEKRLLQRHFRELSSKYVDRRLGAIVTAE